MKNKLIGGNINSKTNIILLILQIGVIITSFLLYFLNRDRITPEFLDKRLLKLKDEYIENFNNTNENTNENTIVDIKEDLNLNISVDEKTYPVGWSINKNNMTEDNENTNYISNVRNQLQCGTCNFFANASQISDCINKKYGLNNRTKKDCESKSHFIVSVQDLIEKLSFNNCDIGTATGEYNILLNNNVIDDGCNLYKKSLQYFINNIYSNNTSNKTDKSLRLKLILFLSFFALILILFTAYSLKYVRLNIVKIIILILTSILSLLFIVLIITLLNESLKTKFLEKIIPYLSIIDNYYIFLYMGVILSISILNIVNICINFNKNIHDNIFSSIILYFSIIVLFLFIGFKKRDNILEVDTNINNIEENVNELFINMDNIISNNSNENNKKKEGFNTNNKREEIKLNYNMIKDKNMSINFKIIEKNTNNNTTNKYKIFDKNNNNPIQIPSKSGFTISSLNYDIVEYEKRIFDFYYLKNNYFNESNIINLNIKNDNGEYFDYIIKIILKEKIENTKFSYNYYYKEIEVNNENFVLNFDKEIFHKYKYEEEYTCIPKCKIDRTYKLNKLYLNKKFKFTDILFRYNYNLYYNNIKKLIKKLGGIKVAIPLYNKDCFKLFNKDKIIHYTPPYTLEDSLKYKNTGGHAMHVIGWITIDDNNDKNIPPGEYWIVKNSWGTNIHHNGFIYIRMFDKLLINNMKPEDYNYLSNNNLYNFLENSRLTAWDIE